MALPTITQRPIKEIIPTGDVYSCFDSRWNALHNPVVYQILNDKWPVNNLDAAWAITGHADDNGNVEFVGLAHAFTTLEWVTITGSTVTSYNGTWQIIDSDATHITLDLAYEAGAIGGAIIATLYYQNYHSLIQVWAGIPVGHVLAAEDPIVLVATIKALPDDVNLSKVDVSSLARDHVNLLNDLGLIDNDTNLWTGIYIKFAESYDSSDGTDVTQFVSNYTDDVAELVYGVQAKMPFQNIYGGNMAAYVINDCYEALFMTKFTDPVLWTGRYFDLSFIYDKPTDRIQPYFLFSEFDSNQQRLNTSIIEAGAEGVTTFNYTDSTEKAGQTFTFNEPTPVRQFAIKIDSIIGAPTKPFDLVVRQVIDTGAGGGVPWDDATGLILTLTNIDIVAGWNIYDINFNLFGQYAFYLDPQAGGTYNGANYYRLENDNTNPYAGGTFIREIIGTWIPQGGNDLTTYVSLDRIVSVNDLDEGIYRLQINNLLFTGVSIMAYLRFREDLFLNSGFTGNMSNWDNVGGLEDWVYGADAVTSVGAGFSSSFLTQTGLDIKAGTRYYWQINISAITGSHRIRIIGYDGGILGGVVPEDTTLAQRVDNTGLISGTFIASVDLPGLALQASTQPATTINITVTSFELWELADSEEQQVLINSDCEKQSIYLTWLNNLGGWEYWNFTAEKEYGVDIEDSSEFDANIFVDWDDNFINGETVTALEQVKARDTRVVRSQFLTQSQVTAIANIKTSIRVQQIRDDNTKITVLVDKGSFRIREDQQKLYTIEFAIRYTDLIPVQDA